METWDFTRSRYNLWICHNVTESVLMAFDGMLWHISSLVVLKRELKHVSKMGPRSSQTGIFREGKVNTFSADALALCAAGSSAVTLLTIQIGHCLLEGGYLCHPSVEKWQNLHIRCRWFSTRLQYLQCVSNIWRYCSLALSHRYYARQGPHRGWMTYI